MPSSVLEAFGYVYRSSRIENALVDGGNLYIYLLSAVRLACLWSMVSSRPSPMQRR